MRIEGFIGRLQDKKAELMQVDARLTGPEAAAKAGYRLIMQIGNEAYAAGNQSEEFWKENLRRELLIVNSPAFDSSFKEEK